VNNNETLSKKEATPDRKVILSALWLVVLINMIYADILSLMDPSSPIRNVMNGAEIPAGGLLAGAILMESAIVMIILSRVLSYRANRLVSTFVCVINILAVVTGGHGTYYLFFATIETLCMLIILWLSWRKKA